ncbi:hypothetical protein A2884_02145 [Candidatus Saccharibacteria bacterium RIFCSPHIGHO2_01_FULL_48_12]|nr:MAG: hypothetical protein A2884_02145 [Candidatus Saccharibacteria bacterium RIFCSPHIGHO2_01_FULL_48_12]OGL34950.1 MAG: hypothetical protein A3F38_02400 [Candidatus Saccharibacteria bacterium RIFCSPHIGHO2_12_FULL_48_21]
MGKLIRARYSVWQASLLGACAIAFGLGILLAGYFSSTFGWLVIIVGVLIHGYGMYRMYSRKK